MTPDQAHAVGLILLALAALGVAGLILQLGAERHTRRALAERARSDAMAARWWYLPPDQAAVEAEVADIDEGITMIGEWKQ